MTMRSLVAVLVLCLASLGLSGCASKYGQQTTKVELYPDCYEPIKQLRSSENSVAGKTIGGAVGGGLLSFATCALINRGGSNCAGAAVAGAIAGGTAGYFYAVQQKSADENARMAHYLQDLDGDISNLNIATASARMSIQCYEKKFNVSLAQYKKKEISREQLDASYKEIKSGVDESSRILGQIIDTAQKNDALYVAAINEEEKLQPSRQQPVKRATQTKSLGDVKVAQASYKASIADAQKAQKSADNFSAKMAENMS
jgi:plasmid maintenance system killer protein/uncharacterized protein YceK